MWADEERELGNDPVEIVEMSLRVRGRGPSYERLIGVNVYIGPSMIDKKR